MIEVVYNIDGMRQLAAENAALKTELAALKAQEPVAWVQDVEEEMTPEFAFSWVKTALHDTPLFTAPQAQDKDGERYRWLTLTSDSNKLMVIDVLTQRLYFGYEADEAIDAAMKESK